MSFSDTYLDEMVHTHKLNYTDFMGLMANERFMFIVSPTAPTAFINLEKRCITVPNWYMPRASVLAFVCHEVAHGIWTPEEGWHSTATSKGILFKDILNIVEDGRIERLMKRKYSGTRVFFERSYEWLFKTKGFFGSKTLEGMNKKNFLSRLNFELKTGGKYGLKFSQSERVLIEECNRCETWDDVVKASEKILKTLKVVKLQSSSMKPDFLFTSDDDDENEKSETGTVFHDTRNSEKKIEPVVSEDRENEDCESEDEIYTDMDFVKPDEDEDEKSSLVVTNDNSLDHESFKHDHTASADDDTSVDLSEAPEGFFDNDEEFQDGLSFSFEEDELVEKTRVFGNPYDDSQLYSEWYKAHSEETSTFTKNYHVLSGLDLEIWNNIEKNVKVMTTDFLIKKNAESRRSVSYSRTGKIDTARLSEYKTSDNIFKRKTNRGRMQNHGLVFVLDNSISMAGDRLAGSIIQLITLAMFCQMAGIPFKAFTLEDDNCKFPLIVSDKTPNLVKKLKALLEVRNNPFNLICYTPLNSNMFVISEKLKEFKRMEKLDKMHLVYLTDGGSNGSSMLRDDLTYCDLVNNSTAGCRERLEQIFPGIKVSNFMVNCPPREYGSQHEIWGGNFYPIKSRTLVPTPKPVNFKNTVSKNFLDDVRSKTKYMSVLKQFITDIS